MLIQYYSGGLRKGTPGVGSEAHHQLSEGVPAQPRGTQTSDGLPRLSTHDPRSPQVKAAGEISPAVTLKKKKKKKSAHGQTKRTIHRRKRDCSYEDPPTWQQGGVGWGVGEGATAPPCTSEKDKEIKVSFCANEVCSYRT